MVQDVISNSNNINFSGNIVDNNNSNSNNNNNSNTKNLNNNSFPAPEKIVKINL